MSISPAKFIPYEMKATTIKIYSYQNKFLCGTLANPYYEGSILFENAIQFLLLTEELLDSLFFPQKSMELRQFPKSVSANSTLPKTDPQTFEGKSPLATFEIEVLFRQNASWQGNVSWLEQNTSASFRSFMELITLMDGVLSEGETK